MIDLLSCFAIISHLIYNKFGEYLKEITINIGGRNIVSSNKLRQFFKWLRTFNMQTRGYAQTAFLTSITIMVIVDLLMDEFVTNFRGIKIFNLIQGAFILYLIFDIKATKKRIYLILSLFLTLNLFRLIYFMMKGT